jgi:hypothetical protein
VAEDTDQRLHFVNMIMKIHITQQLLSYEFCSSVSWGKKVAVILSGGPQSVIRRADNCLILRGLVNVPFIVCVSKVLNHQK